MFENDFKDIENFLKSGGNSELHVFESFETIVNNFIKERFDENIKSGFLTFNQLLYQSYEKFDKHNSNVIKDFAISIIIIKNLLEKLQNSEENDILSEEDKKIYIDLIKILSTTIKKEAEAHLSFFSVFSEYIDGINNLFNN